MSDTLSLGRVASIREYLSHLGAGDVVPAQTAQALLDHIDSHMEAVEKLPPCDPGPLVNGCVDRRAVYDILGGKQDGRVRFDDLPPDLHIEYEAPRTSLDFTIPAVREAQIYGGDDRARQVAAENWPEPPRVPDGEDAMEVIRYVDASEELRP